MDSNRRIIDGGSGYSQPPRVMILNGPPNMSAVAPIDPTTGKVSDVTVTNQGSNRRTRYFPEFTFVGGLNWRPPLRQLFPIMMEMQLLVK